MRGYVNRIYYLFIWKKGINIQKNKIQFDKDEFIKKYDELGSSRKMSEYYQCSKTSILSYAKSINYVNNYRVRLTEEQIKYINDNYYFKTSTRLADELKVSSSLISKVWRENGLKGKTNNKYKVNQHYFENIDSKDKAYFLGFLAADGNVHKRKNNENCQAIIRLSLNSYDEMILETFKQYIENDSPISKSKRVLQDGTIHYTSCVEFVSDVLANDLAKYNIVPHKTYDFITPNISFELYSHYIRGYFDGDGSICSNKSLYTSPSSYEISISGYEHNLIIIQNILLKNNIITILAKDKRNYNGDDDFCQIKTSNIENTYKFLNYIYQDCDDLYLPRKKYLYDKFLTSIKNNYSNKQNIYNKFLNAVS